MKQHPVLCAAKVQKEDDGTYTVVVEVSGLSRARAFEVAQMLEQPVCNALESFGDLKPCSTEFGRA